MMSQYEAKTKQQLNGQRYKQLSVIHMFDLLETYC